MRRHRHFVQHLIHKTIIFFTRYSTFQANLITTAVQGRLTGSSARAGLVFDIYLKNTSSFWIVDIAARDEGEILHANTVKLTGKPTVHVIVYFLL